MEKNKGELIKVCFAASSGGHFEQLLMLKPLMEKYNSFIVTERTKYNVVTDIPSYYVMQINRKEFLFVFKMFINFLKSIYIIVKEKPDAIICTGVLAMISLCIIGKIGKSKLIYIESFAKVSSATESGKFLYRFADRFYVQWEELLEKYPKAVYIGKIY